MNQNYIKIFKNVSGGITVKYAAVSEDAQSVDIDTISFEVEDLTEIAHSLLYFSEESGE